MEPERKIEKLLRAYAKKRRAEAGDSLKLHPATRRLLQGEAARRAPRPGKAGTPGFFLAVFWRRLVFALCVVATAFIGVSLFRPAWNPAKKGAPSVSAMNNLRQTGTATKPYAGDNKHVLSASLDELTNQKSAEFVLAEKVAPETLAKAAPGAPMAAATPPPALEVAGDLEKSKPVGGTLQSLAQTGTASPQQNLYRNVSVAAPTASVMQSFQVLQNGDAISVVDRDGSVYQGSIQVAAAVEHNEPAGACPGRSGRAAADSDADRSSSVKRTAREPILFLPRGGNEPDVEAKCRVQRQHGGDFRRACQRQQILAVVVAVAWRRKSTPADHCECLATKLAVEFPDCRNCDN